MEIFGNFYAFQYLQGGGTIGFIHDFFAGSVKFLTAVFHDNACVRDDIISYFGINSVNSQKLVVAYHPAPQVDQSPLRNRAEEPCDADILWASRLDDEKLPEVVAEIARQLPGTTFHVWGSRTVDGGGVPKCLVGISNIKLMGRYGSFGDILRTYRYRGFMFTSRWEGMPNVLLEAAAARLPIIAPDVGGIRELITDGVTGYLIPSALDVAEYVGSVRKVIAEPDKSEELAERAWMQLQTTFTWPQFASTVRGWYLVQQLPKCGAEGARTDELPKL